MSKFPHAVEPEIVAARKDGNSVVLIVQMEEKETNHHNPFTGAKWDPPLVKAVRYEFRMNEGVACYLLDQLDHALMMFPEGEDHARIQ